MLKKVGTIKKTYGVAGALVIDDFTYVIDEVPAGTEMFIGFSESFSDKFKVEEWENLPKTANVKFEGIASRERAAQFLDKALFADEDVFRSISSHFDNTSDIVGLRVIDVATGRPLGTIAEVWIMPANDVWLVVDDEGELPIPVIDQVVKKIDQKNGIVEIELIDGLLELKSDKKH